MGNYIILYVVSYHFIINNVNPADSRCFKHAALKDSVIFQLYSTRPNNSLLLCLQILLDAVPLESATYEQTSSLKYAILGLVRCLFLQE